MSNAGLGMFYLNNLELKILNLIFNLHLRLKSVLKTDKIKNV